MESFEKIYKLYFKDVYCFILSMCRDGAEAEDITQETFFCALKNIDSFRGGCKMTVWLCQIAKHIYFARQKDYKRHHSKSLEEAESSAGGIVKIERLLEDDADAMKIHELLHQLDEPYKEVFMLRVFGELSFKRIAHIFSKSESWARVTYHRAKLKLIEKMEGNDE